MAVEPLALDEVRDDLRAAVLARNAERVGAILRNLPPDDAARVLDELTPQYLGAAMALIGDEQLAGVIENFPASEAARLLVKLGRAEAADILEEMDPDDAADVVEEMRDEDAAAILIEMEAPHAAELRELLAYPPESAAGHMTGAVVTVSPDLSVEQALVAIRRVAQEAETIYYVYVTDNADKLLGVLSLRDLVLAAPNAPITQITRRDLVKVRADADQEVAARMLTERGLLALPVVDADNTLLGIITADDVADVLVEEASEDIARLGGSEPLDEPYMRSSVWALARKRIPWLLLLFLGGALTSNVLHYFQETLDTVVALTLFIPLLIGTGGNVGSQTVSLLVRAMGVGEVQFRDVGRVLVKELSVGLMIGAIMAAAGFVRALTLGEGYEIAITVAFAAAFIVLWAAMVSAVLPLVIRRVGVDPAVVSAPLITTVVDATGLFLYLSVARLLLGF